jgi:hypothetical protein
VDRCTDYVKGCQNPDGGFRYQLKRHPESLFPRSAAALVALHSAGVYEGPEVEQATAYVLRHSPGKTPQPRESHYLYGHYYAAQAVYQVGGEAWTQWYAAICAELVKQQLPEGSWADASICNEYATAMACLILQMPESHLPIFQR